MNYIIDLLRADGSIIINKKLSRAIGLHEAIMYSEILSKYCYFKNNNKIDKDGYFFNTIEDMEHDTNLSRHQQTESIKKLVELNLLEYKVKGMPAKRYFKLNEDMRFLQEILQYANNLQTCMQETNKHECKKVARNNTKLNYTNNNTKYNPADAENIITLWNSEANDLFKADTKNKAIYKAINKTLKTESPDDILKAIKTYFSIVKSIEYYYNHEYNLDEFLYRALKKFSNEEGARRQCLKDKRKLDAGLGLYAYYVKHKLLYRNGKVNRSRDRDKPEWHDMGRDCPTSLESYINQMRILNDGMTEQYRKEITGENT
jgi:DNA-binding transcriptional regulator GbsR (MarR family)